MTRCILIVSAMLAAASSGHAVAIYSDPYLFGTVAGNPPFGTTDGPANKARFFSPRKVAIDNGGNIYVADTANHTIRKISPAGEVTTFAGLPRTSGSADGTGQNARFYFPQGVATDAAGNVYVADTSNGTIRKITPTGVVTTLAGQAGLQGSEDGTGAVARFSGPRGLCVDASGSVYVADASNSTIRKITPAGSVTTFAGLAGTFGAVDGTGSAARFRNPTDVAADSNGNILVVDHNNHTIRKITSGGVVSTLAGLPNNPGETDGDTSVARFFWPQSVAVDSADNVYVADTENCSVRRIVMSGGSRTVSTLAGGPTGYADGTGTAAQFQFPSGLAVNDVGDVILADTDNNVIRKITQGGVATTLAGIAGSAGTVDGTGSAARFHGPQGIAVNESGYAYVVDSINKTIRKLAPGGVVTTIAGSPGMSGSADGPGPDARFEFPRFVALDASGNLFVTDYTSNTIRKITPAGAVSTFAGLADSEGSDDGIGSAARFAGPSGIVINHDRNMYVADTHNNTIRKITPTGQVTTFAGSAGAPGDNDGVGSAARFGGPDGLAIDANGNLYVADTNNFSVRKISPSGSVTTLAGSIQTIGPNDGPPGVAGFGEIGGIAADAIGNVYVTDGDRLVRKIDPAGFVTTIGGVANQFGSSDGIGSSVNFDYPVGIAVDGNGNLYVTDFEYNTVRVAVSSLVAHRLSIGLTGDGHIQLAGHTLPNFTVKLSAAEAVNASFSPTASMAADPMGNYQFEDSNNEVHQRQFYRALTLPW